VLAAPTRLELPIELRAAIERASRAAAPREACGLLLGLPIGTEETVVRIVEITVARNAAPPELVTERFEIEPRDVLAADRRARALAVELVGAWHSHPSSPAQPSKLDAEFAWMDGVALIASLEHGAFTLRAWMWNGSSFDELELAADRVQLTGRSHHHERASAAAATAATGPNAAALGSIVPTAPSEPTAPSTTR
jgi:proteasome lid subunit RPN8/RPN11